MVLKFAKSYQVLQIRLYEFSKRVSKDLETLNQYHDQFSAAKFFPIES